MVDISQRLKEANGRLKANCFGVSIEQIGNRLYLRAVLPPKPSSTNTNPHQQKISIANANNEGVKVAEREAKKLSSKLDEKTFDWGDYITEQQKQPVTIGEWISAFEKDYFERRERTFKTETTWKVEYRTVFKVLQPIIFICAIELMFFYFCIVINHAKSFIGRWKYFASVLDVSVF